MHPNIDALGRWPLPGPEARKEKRLIVVRPEDRLPLIHGKNDHVLFDFIVSNDYFHIALMEIPPGKFSEVEQHSGDEALYVLEGELEIRLSDPSSEQEGQALFDSHHISEGEPCFIPEGTAHQYYNFTDKMIRAFVAVGPGL